jgi:hypothetical protein
VFFLVVNIFTCYFLILTIGFFPFLNFLLNLKITSVSCFSYSAGDGAQGLTHTKYTVYH